MIYTAAIEIPANTAEAEAIKTVLQVSKGLIWRIEVEFPPGCAGLAHMRINDGLYQLFPASVNESFASDGSVIGFDDLYLKNAEPFELVITTWNLDEAWPHTISVRVAMASSEAFMSRYMPSISWEKFNTALKAAAEQQAADKQAQTQQIITEVGQGL